MKVQFLDRMQYKTLYKAKKSCNWACKIKKCYMGWMAFENNESYDQYMIEEKRQKLLSKQ